jgi:hypothetical protein
MKRRTIIVRFKYFFHNILRYNVKGKREKQKMLTADFNKNYVRLRIFKMPIKKQNIKKCFGVS